MTVNIGDRYLLPLEKFFNSPSTEKSFPAGSPEYRLRYFTMKDWLSDNLYKYIGSGTSAEDKGIYTDHSIDHFNKVIEKAGELLGIRDDGTFADNDKINRYEAYLLLSAILLHDSGNVYGRQDHEKKTHLIAADMGRVIFPDVFERKDICTMAEVHGGFVKVGEAKDKDTIRLKNVKETSRKDGIISRPALIAGIVRFSDEICEDNSRAARYMSRKFLLPPQSEAYHKYAESIYSVHVDLKDRSVVLAIKIESKNIIKKCGKDDGEVFLIDEIMLRLEKMNCERIYCNKYMHEEVYIKSIKAEIEIYNNDNDLVDTLNLKLSDVGYPSNTENLRTLHPKWTGESLAQRMEITHD